MKRVVKISAAVGVVAAIAVVCVFGMACDGPLPNAELVVDIIQEPQGGLYVNTVTCIVEVEVKNANLAPGELLNQAIKLNWEWRTPSGKYNADEKVFRYNGQKETLVMSKSAPSGLYLDKKFWLSLSWVDELGKKSLVSDTADCRVN